MLLKQALIAVFPGFLCGGMDVQDVDQYAGCCPVHAYESDRSSI